MKQMMALKEVKKYLKENHIYFIEDFENAVPRLIMVFQNNLPDYPDQMLDYPDNLQEICICFLKDGIEARCYYRGTTANFFKESQYKAELYRFMNYINAKVFIQNIDTEARLHLPRCLHTSRFYVSEDGDISVSVLIAYDWFEIVPLEILDFITISHPVILNQFSNLLFFLLLGQKSAEEAMAKMDKIIEN